MESIVFAFYKNESLIGYRLDTVGSIGFKYPKIYTYSKEQVNTVLDNISYVVLNKKGFGEALGIDFLKERESQTHEMLQDKKAFEVRVLRSPGYPVEKVFDVKKAEMVEEIVFHYPKEEMDKWLENPNLHEVIETHSFSINGLLSMN